MSNVFPMAIVAPNRLAGSADGASKNLTQSGSFGNFYSDTFEKNAGEAAFHFGQLELETDQGSPDSSEQDSVVEGKVEIEQCVACPKQKHSLETENRRNLTDFSAELGPKLEKVSSLAFPNKSEMVSKVSADVVPPLATGLPVEMRSENARQIADDGKPNRPILQGFERGTAFFAFSANIHATATATATGQVNLTDESRIVRSEIQTSASVTKSDVVAPEESLPERPSKPIEQLRVSFEKSPHNVDTQSAKLSDNRDRVLGDGRNVSREMADPQVKLGVGYGASSRSEENLPPLQSKSGFKMSEAILTATKPQPQADPQITGQSGAASKAEVRASNFIGNLSASSATQPTKPASIPISPEASIPPHRFAQEIRVDPVGQMTIAPSEKAIAQPMFFANMGSFDRGTSTRRDANGNSERVELVNRYGALEKHPKVPLPPISSANKLEAIPASPLFAEGKTTPLDFANENFEQHDHQLIGSRTGAIPLTSATHELKHHPSIQIASSVGHQIAVEVSKRQGGTTEIALNPEELGRVSLSMKAVEGSVTLVISAERPETQDLMRRHIETLAQEFRALGYNDVNLSFQGHGQGEQDGSDKGRSQGVLDPDDVEPLEMDKPRPKIDGLDLRL